MESAVSIATASQPQRGHQARILSKDPEAGVDPAIRAKLRRSADEFESVFLSQMLSPMFESVEVDETFGGGHGEEMFRSFLVNEYAKKIGSSGNLGLSDQVYRELLRAQEATHG